MWPLGPNETTDLSICERRFLGNRVGGSGNKHDHGQRQQRYEGDERS